MKMKLGHPINLDNLFREVQVSDLDFVSANIGYDGKIYFLFSSRIPPRIDGMFVDTKADAGYTAVVLHPSWENGTAERPERIDLGRHGMNFHFLLPVPDGSFLLLGARCAYTKAGPEKNAVFTDRNGNVLRKMTFGDGIADCIVRSDGIIITSYFDEGIIGNYGWDDPIGSCGVCAWNLDGEVIWRSGRDIIDCYAMNTDANENLWYYYYTDFSLVRTDFKTETEYEADVQGADCLMTAGRGRYLIMDGGYDDPDSLYISRIQGDALLDREPLEFVGEDDTAVAGTVMAAVGEKALILTGGGNACPADFSAIA